MSFSADIHQKSCSNEKSYCGCGIHLKVFTLAIFVNSIDGKSNVSFGGLQCLLKLREGVNLVFSLKLFGKY